MKRLFILSITFLPLVLSGCAAVKENAPPKNPVTYITTPKIQQIKAAEISGMTPDPSTNTALNLKDPHDKAVLQKVLNWLQAAPFSKIEDLHQPTPSEGPTTLVLTLSNGTDAWVQPATNCSTNGNSTTCTPAYGYVDFQYTNSTKRTRLRATVLDAWLLGTWRQDILAKKN